MIYSPARVLPGSYLTVAGELLDNALLQEVTVVQELNSHSCCDVVCRQTMDKRFPAEDLLGQQLSLSAVDGQGATVEIFTGFILESELEFEIYGSQTARLRAVSQSYLMDTTPRRKYYLQKTPQEVAQELTGAAGLQLAGAIDGQKLSFVQMEETDFRFLLRFVDESEKWLRPTDSGVEVQAAFQSGTTLSWRGEYGLVQFHAVGKLSARELAGSHYDYRKMQSEVLSNVQDDPALYASSARMSAAVKAQSAKLGQGFVTARDRLLSVDDLSPRLQKESRRSTGRLVLCRGVSREQKLKAGDEVTVDGVLDANGTYGLVRVEHRWTVNGYENDFLCTPWRRYTTGEAVPVPRFDGVGSSARGKQQRSGRDRTHPGSVLLAGRQLHLLDSGDDATCGRGSGHVLSAGDRRRSVGDVRRRRSRARAHSGSGVERENAAAARGSVGRRRGSERCEANGDQKRTPHLTGRQARHERNRSGDAGACEALDDGEQQRDRRRDAGAAF